MCAQKILFILSYFLFSLDPNYRNKGTLWTPLHAATFQEHGPVSHLPGTFFEQTLQILVLFSP